jgi:protein SCO1/2
VVVAGTCGIPIWHALEATALLEERFEMRSPIHLAGSRRKSLLTILAAIVVMGSLASCGRAPAPDEKHYPIQGEVIAVDTPNKALTLKHGDIPGLMPAMTMRYVVKDSSALEKLGPGDVISADLVVSESIGRLEKIELVRKAGQAPPKPVVDLHIPTKGDNVPDFHLVNQNGKPIHLQQFKGDTVLITFIYTHCPLPDFCPRMNHNFSKVQEILKDKPQILHKTEFVSISFDPAHDTPEVLKHYAGLYNKRADGKPANNWQFAVPSKADLPEIATFFGLIYEPEQGEISHSSSTTIVAPDGKVELWYRNNEWTPEDAAQTIEKLAGARCSQLCTGHRDERLQNARIIPAVNRRRIELAFRQCGKVLD